MRTRSRTLVRDQVLGRAVAVGGGGRRVDRLGSESGGFSRRSSSPSTAPNSRWRQVACANARPEPHSCGNAAAGCEPVDHERARPGREVLGQPGERPAQRRAGPGRRGRALRRRAPNSRAVGDVHREPDRMGGGRRRARSARAARRRRSRRRRRAGRAAAARPRRPRRRRRRARLGGCGCGRGPCRDCNARRAARCTARGGRTTHRPTADHSRLHARARDRGVNPIVYWLMRALAAAVRPPLLAPVADRARARPESGPGDLRLQPPLVPRPVHHRRRSRAGRCTTWPRRSCSATGCSAGSSARSARSRSAAAPPTPT